MITPEKQRRHAGCLYLMASDAFERGERKFAELLVTLANRYADRAAGLQSADDQHRQMTEVAAHPAGRRP